MSQKKTEYNKEVCDLKHEEIKSKLSELRKISYVILALVISSFAMGALKGEPEKVAKVLLSALMGLIGV